MLLFVIASVLPDSLSHHSATVVVPQARAL